MKDFCEHYNGHFETPQLGCDVHPDRITLTAPSPSATLTLTLNRGFQSVKVRTSYDDPVDLQLRMQGASLIFVLNGREDISPEDVAHSLATDLAEKLVVWVEEAAT